MRPDPFQETSRWQISGGSRTKELDRRADVITGPREEDVQKISKSKLDREQIHFRRSSELTWGPDSALVTPDSKSIEWKPELLRSGTCAGVANSLDSPVLVRSCTNSMRVSFPRVALIR
jgi:hypothetical protein